MGTLQKPIKSKHYIQSLIEEGEHEHQDFKFQISDSRKIARSISAFANNDGGHLLVGVKDNGNIGGIKSDEEIYMIEQAATTYCRPPQVVEFSIYRIEGKDVLKVDISRAAVRPVKAQDDDRKWRTYFRVADENILAHPMHVKLMQNSGEEAQFTYGDNEQMVVDSARANGSVTIDEYMKLAHISRQTAEQSLLALCRIGTLMIKYVGGNMVFVAE